MADERRAPVQESHTARVWKGMAIPKKPRGTIAWWEHEEAAREYNRHWTQDAETLARRGGFGYGELMDHLGHEPTTWLPLDGAR